MGWGRISYYNNKRITHDGVSFRSKDEIFFWEYCKKKKAKGEILNFEYEPDKFELMPKFNFAGKLIHAMTYTPDFKVYHNDGTVKYYEIKGVLTSEATLKVKLFKYFLFKNNPELKYQMIKRSLKYGNIDGEFIDYDEYNAIKRKEKREKVKPD